MQFNLWQILNTKYVVLNNGPCMLNLSLWTKTSAVYARYNPELNIKITAETCHRVFIYETSIFIWLSLDVCTAVLCVCVWLAGLINRQCVGRWKDSTASDYWHNSGRKLHCTLQEIRLVGLGAAIRSPPSDTECWKTETHSKGRCFIYSSTRRLDSRLFAVFFLLSFLPVRFALLSLCHLSMAY